MTIKKFVCGLLIACVMTGSALAQSPVAKFIFEDAEAAFAKQNYKTTLAKLDEAEKEFGKINPPILYLRIMARYELLKGNPTDFDTVERLRSETTLFLKEYGNLESVQDKAREVYRVSAELKQYPATSAEYEAMLKAEEHWGTVAAKKVSLFYPGTTSWEYLTGEDHGAGGNAVVKVEKTCQECHVKDNRFDIFADDLIKGKLRRKSKGIPFETDPPKGITGFKDLELQAKYDSTNIYLKLKWPSPDGASFKDPSLDEKGLSDRVAIQLNGNLKSFSKTGCFMACHDDSAYMPDAPSESEVSANPFYANQKRKDVRLYTYFTRSRGWSGMRPEQDMEKYLKAGGFIDLWIAGFKGQDIVVSDESVFYDRVRDSSQDIVAQGNWQDGFYTVVIKRKLATQDQMDIQLKEGKTFNVGIALYDNKNGHRKHFVSFPMSVTLGGGQADVAAVKLGEAIPQSKP